MLGSVYLQFGNFNPADQDLRFLVNFCRVDNQFKLKFLKEPKINWLKGFDFQKPDYIFVSVIKILAITNPPKPAEELPNPYLSKLTLGSFNPL